MYNVLIVDDEPWVAYGIANLIDWESLGFTIIGEAHDGLSALDIIIDKKPELVISDIRMPGLDGIELLEKVNGLKLETKVALISGYADFAYAQRAVRLGAFDYLLKQIEKDKLLSMVERFKVGMLQNEKATEERELPLDDLFEFLEADNNFTIGNFLSNRGLAFNYPHYRFLCCKYCSSTISFFSEQKLQVNGLQSVRIRTGHNKISILINYDESKQPVKVVDYITDNLAGVEFVGISSIGLYATPIAKLYQESDIAMFTTSFHRGKQTLYYEAQELPPEIRKIILKLEVSIKEQTREKIETILDHLGDECNNQLINIDLISSIYNQVVSLIYKYHGHSGKINEISHLQYEVIARSYESIKQLFDGVKAFFDQLSGEEVFIPNEKAKKIIEYIDSSFTEDILLSEIAKAFNFSIGYVSTLIKKETGVTYSEYIMYKRLNTAKELMNDPSLSIQDIVHRVGYKDYFHFNKLFKKHFGITPSKFRKL
ncbi:MAG TPA: response regulator [Candidatus Paenibacillus intestinavium]|nr:response regulator [Candidatus Paenibacillus intestinavium]